MSIEISVSPSGRMPVAGALGPDSTVCRPGAIDCVAAEMLCGASAALPASSVARTNVWMVFMLETPFPVSVQAGKVVEGHGDGLLRAGHAVGLLRAFDDIEFVGGMRAAAGSGHAAGDRDVDR